MANENYLRGNYILREKLMCAIIESALQSSTVKETLKVVEEEVEEYEEQLDELAMKDV